MGFGSGDPKILFKVMFSVEDLRRQSDRWKELELEHIEPSEADCLNKNIYPPRYVSSLVDLSI